jgi:hypothetical protein
MDLQEELIDRFTYHEPTDDQVDKYQAIRKVGLLLSSMIVEFCPDSKERSLALTKVDEAVMWGNASIARNS